MSQLTDEESKRQFLQAFWGRREAASEIKGTPKRADYLQRVTFANENYSHFQKAGWQTDRGRVFIVYGPPDQVERHPSEVDSKPYEVWSYFQIESGVEFVFLDKTGFGDYELVHSTKRGELRDDDWERFLH